MNPLGPTKTRPYLADAMAEFYQLHAYDQNQGMAMKWANDFLDTTLPGKFLLSLLDQPTDQETGKPQARPMKLEARVDDRDTLCVREEFHDMWIPLFRGIIPLDAIHELATRINSFNEDRLETAPTKEQP